MEDTNELNGTLPSEYYKRKESDRIHYEDRAELIAKLTLPYAHRDDSDDGTTRMADGTSQSFGGRLVNTLTSKIGMALLPPSTSSFRYVPDAQELEALTGGDEDNKAKTYKAMSQNIDMVNNEIEIQQIRNSLFDMMRQLLIVGSVVVEKVKRKGMKLHTLLTFVADLDDRGEPVKFCFVEMMKRLPDGIEPIDGKEKDEYELYTMATLDENNKSWTVVQELEGELVGVEQKYKTYLDLPFRYLGWTWMVGDDYHRPFAEDYYQDLLQLDKLARLLTDGAIVAAKTLLFVNERGGRTRKDDVAQSKNGDIIDGVADDVTPFVLGKNFDFQVVQEREAMLKKELAAGFLMNESAARDAERVTAAEIQFMAQELESSSLSGIYSKMALQWSKWNVHQIMLELDIKFESIEVQILTGLDALGRSQEAQKLDNLLQRAAGLDMMGWFNQAEIINRYASFDGVNTVDLIKTPNEKKTEEAAKAKAAQNQLGEEALAQSAGAAVGQGVGDAVNGNIPQQ